jgi:uncharacterized membrane protein
LDSLVVHFFAFVYGIAFVIAGIEHFRGPQKFVEIVPPYFPFALFLVYLTGAMEIAGGLGIIYPETRVLGTERWKICCTTWYRC